MKYKDIEYYINTLHDYYRVQVNSISLSKEIFIDIFAEIYEPHCEDSDYFYHNGIKFTLDKLHNYKNYMIIYLYGQGAGYGYDVLTEDERIIKDIIE